MKDKMVNWKVYLRFDSTFHLHIFFLYMALFLLGKKYVTYPYICILLWVGYGLFHVKCRQILLETVRSHRRVVWIGALIVLYGIINFISTVVNQGRADAWDGWERVVAWLFCGIVGVWLSGIHSPERIYICFSRWQAAMLLFLTLIVVGSSLKLFPYIQLGVLDFKTKVDTIFEMLCLSTYVNAIAGSILSKRDRCLQIVTLVIGFTGIFMMGTSRLLVPVMGMGILLAAWHGRNSALTMMPAVLAVLGLATFALRPDMFNSLAGITLSEPLYWRTTVLNYRDIVWHLSLVMFASHPWLGIGPGNFASVSAATRQAIGLLDPSNQNYIHAHNLWGNPFVACGIFGGAAHALLMIYTMGLILKKLEWIRTRPMALNLLMIWSVYQFYGLVEMAPTMEEIIPYVWGGTGLMAGMLTAPPKKASSF